MVILCRDLLSEYFDDKIVNSRFDYWLFYYLTKLKNSTIKSLITGASDTRDEIAKELYRLGIFRNDVIEERKKYLIPKENFHWLENTKHFGHWFIDRVHLKGNPDKENILNIEYKDLCIAIMDAKIDSIDNKIHQLKRMNAEWNYFKKTYKEFDWVCIGDVARNIEYAQQAAMYFRPNRLPRIVTTHDDLIILLDDIRISPQEAHHASASARRKLSQKKYRDESKTKKQINALVNKTTFINLERLSTKHNLSKARIIETLINMENKYGRYISDEHTTWPGGNIN